MTHLACVTGTVQKSRDFTL